MGIDEAPGGKIDITVAVGIPRALAGGGGGGESGGGQGPVILLQTVRAASIPEGLQLLNTTINRRLVVYHNKVFLFGRSLAEKGLERFLFLLARGRQYRRDVPVMITEGKASDALRIQPTLEQNPALYLYTLERLSDYTGYFPSTNVTKMLLAYDALGEEAILPIVHLTPVQGVREEASQSDVGQLSHVQLSGTALFRNDRMVGELTPNETQVLLLLRGEWTQPAVMVVKNPSLGQGGEVTVEIQEEIPPKIKVIDLQPKPRLRVEIRMDGEIVDQHSSSIITLSEDVLEQIEQEVSRSLINRMEEVIEHLQKLGVDSVGFGNYIRGRMLTEEEWMRYRWPEQFPHAEIELRIDIELRRTGMVTEPPRVRGT